MSTFTSEFVCSVLMPFTWIPIETLTCLLLTRVDVGLLLMCGKKFVLMLGVKELSDAVKID